MDKAEAVAEKFLIGLGHKKIVYEPDGNIPPDFLIDDKIAVEVRRLNQNVDNGGQIEGLESTAIPLAKFLERLCANSGAPTDGHSWFLMYDFDRPLKLDKKLKTDIQANFPQPNSFIPKYRQTIYKTNNLEVELWPSSLSFKTRFVIGGSIDGDSGGWLASEYLENVKLIASEKDAKVAPYKQKYQEWWLVLPDLIGGLSYKTDVNELPKLDEVKSTFDKIILVSPLDPNDAYEIR